MTPTVRSLWIPGAALTAVLIAGCSPPGTAEPAVMGAPPRPMTSIGPTPGPQAGSPSTARSNPFENDAAARQDGRQLFVRFNCSGCHGGHAGGGMGPSLRDDTWIYGKSPEHIFSSISQGRARGMPAWGTLLPEEQIWKLVSYVHTLGSDEEASPPSPAPVSASPGVAALVE